MTILISTLAGGETKVGETSSRSCVPACGVTCSHPRTTVRRQSIYNAMHQRRPAVKVRPDRYRRRRRRGQLRPRAEPGGRSTRRRALRAGLSSCDGGMVIDLTRMRAVSVDPVSRRASVQGGAVWADVDRETQAFGLVVPGGVVSETGVGGLTLGGGEGWVRRKYGLTIDSLRSATVVVPTVRSMWRPPTTIRTCSGPYAVAAEFRRRHELRVRRAPARPDRRVRRRLRLHVRRGRDPSPLARSHRGRARRGHVGRRRDLHARGPRPARRGSTTNRAWSSGASTPAMSTRA